MAQPRELRSRARTAFIVPALALAEPALSDEPPYEDPEAERNQFLILGAGVAPEYVGSGDYSAVPFIVSEFEVGRTGWKIEGLSAQVALARMTRWQGGAVLDLDTGRDDSVSNLSVASMNTLDPAINAGVFLAYQRESVAQRNDEIEWQLSLLTELSSVHQGGYARLSATYVWPLMIPWRVEAELEATYADRAYSQTYFGVSAADAAQSGLSRFEAGNGFTQINASANIGLFLSPEWGILTRLSVGQLLQDANDSPVTRAGDDMQYFAGLGIYHRF